MVYPYGPGNDFYDREWQDMLSDLEKIFGELRRQFVDLRKSSVDDLPKRMQEIDNLLGRANGFLSGLKPDIQAAIEPLQRRIQELSGQLNAKTQEYEIKIRDLLNLWDGREAELKNILQISEEARHELEEKFDELIKELQPPLPHGTFLWSHGDGTANILLSDGREIRAAVPSYKLVAELIQQLGLTIADFSEEKHDSQTWKLGQKVLLLPNNNILTALPGKFEETGEEATIDEIFNDGRVRLVTAAEGARIVRLAEPLKGQELDAGDAVSYNSRLGIAFEKLPKVEAKEYLMEEIADITFDDVGGQEGAIALLTEYILDPIRHPDLFMAYNIKSPNGILLHGSPGCGKTLIVTAVGNILKRELGKKAYLFTVRGPEFLTKWVGETEAKIRQPFLIAQKKTRKEDALVIILFDEIEAIFPTRGTVAGDPVVDKAVTQFSTMLDGVQKYGNIIVIGTTNRQDMIDPALLRPGRLHPQIKVNRPDRDGTAQIFRIHLRGIEPNLHPKYFDSNHPEYQEEKYKQFGASKENFAAYLVKRAVDRIYGEDSAHPLEKQRVVTVEFTTGEKKDFYMKDLISGADIASMVDRAKRFAIRDELKGRERGLRISHLLNAIEHVFAEKSFSYGQTDSPMEWARILDLPLTVPFRIVNVAEDSQKKSLKKSKTEPRSVA